jgi:hypothetical protein
LANQDQNKLRKSALSSGNVYSDSDNSKFKNSQLKNSQLTKSQPVLSAKEFRGRSRECRHSVFIKGVKKWDSFWEAVSEGRQGGCCYRFGIPPGGMVGVGELSSEIDLPSNTAEAIYLNLPVKESLRIRLTLNLNKESNVVLIVVGEVLDGGQLNLEIESRQDTVSNFKFLSRFVVSADTNLKVKTKGMLSPAAFNAVCNYETKVLQLDNSAQVYGYPEIDIANNSVEAKHGFSVGNIPESKLIYLMNRGLSEDEATAIYSKGFLKEVL